jgi:homoserine O-succinyltransferase
MPLVAHSKLPTFSDLRNQGHEVLTLDRAVHQDIRELHIGFLNMMPDAALRATERQFIRLVGSCNRIAQFFVYPFSLPTLERSAKAVGYIDRYYSDFESLRDAGLDALIITGANVANPRLENEAFWAPLMEVVDWAWDNVASMLGVSTAIVSARSITRCSGISTRASTCRTPGTTTSRGRNSRRPGS